MVPRDKKSHIAKLKSLLKDADELYLATDEDREGEAIAWHLLDELKPKVPVHRMVFHEITRPAILEAVANPRQINDDLVEAQEARRILDRLYGYEVSPVLWKKVMSGLSAGRVQSVATRLVVDRERERMAFRVASYWDLEGTFDALLRCKDRPRAADVQRRRSTRSTRCASPAAPTSARPTGSAEERACGRTASISTEAGAEALVAALRDTSYDVRSVESKPYRRSPYAPFRTTTLQQEASRKLGMSASGTMSVAQRLYENGFITYMRTDSTTLSSAAVNAARSQVRELYGAEYLPDAPRTYASKVKNAQEAHEAIRPSGERFRTPAETGLSGDQFRLYELIWMRTVASQMKDAVGQSVTIRLGGAASGRREDDVLRQRPHDHLPRLPQGLRRERVDAEAKRRGRRRDAGCRTCTEVDERLSRELPSSRGPLDQAAGPLHRGHADPRARGARDRPAVDVRLHHRHHPEPRLRLQEGHGSGAGLARLRRGPTARAALRPARRLQLHRGHGGRARRDRRRRRKDRVTELGEFYFGSGQVRSGGLKELVTDLGAIDAKELATFLRSLKDSTAADQHRPAGRSLRPVPRGSRHGRIENGGEDGSATGSRPSARTCPTTCRPTS